MFLSQNLASLFDNLSPAEWCVAGVILLVASVVRGLTGFGFSAIIVTGLSLILLPAQTVVLALLLEIVASIHLLPSAWKNINWPLLGALGIGLLVGTPIGVSLLAWLDPDVMRLVISSLVLTFALLLFNGYSYRGPQNFSAYSGVGLLSGICNGTAALGGLPIVTFLLSTQAKVETTRATLIAAFLGTDIYALILAGGHGLVTSVSLIYALISLPIVIGGVSLGKRLFNKASPRFFKRSAILLLLGLSLTGIIRAIAKMV